MTDAAPTPATTPWPAMSIQQAHALLTQPGSPLETEEIEIRGIRTKVWKHLPPTLRSTVETGRTFGDRIFLVYEDERVTFEAFHRAVAAFAKDLQAKGVKKGDRIALIMRNLPEWPVAFYGAMCVGAICTPLNAWWTGPELEYGLTDSGSKIAIMDAERLERLREHLHNCPDLEHVYVSRESEEIAHPKISKLEDAIGGANDWASLPDQPLPDVDLQPDDDATIFYTSGTTGKP
ncbi:MAG TPA: class I adenylate-forming enzyme family protein, partial [Caulobacteraceae bacterium]|nr:class I adenylate-forming enzyme family protein [Caulobacteraceae bacterium]